MTTNHRPTLESKRGRANQISDSISHSRSLPQQQTLKLRADTKFDIDQSHINDLKRQLLQSEGKIVPESLPHHKRQKNLSRVADSQNINGNLLGTNETQIESLKRLDQDSHPNTQPQAGELDANADVISESDSNADSEEESDSNSDSEDETAALMAELQKIRQERKAEQEKKQQESVENAMVGNPLVNIDDSSPKPQKKSWRKSTAFNKKATSEAKKVPQFNNETLKSDFHKDFLSKHIR